MSIEAVGASGTTDLSTFPSPGARVVVVSGETSAVAASPVVTALARAFAALPVPTIAGEIYSATDDQPARGTVVAHDP